MPKPGPARLSDRPRGSLAELAPLFLGIFTIGTNLFVVVPLLPAIRQDFGVASLGDLGLLLVGAYALPYALLAPALGPASDRLGRPPVMAAGLGLLGISALAAGLAPSLTILTASRAAAGIGAALFTPAAYAHIGDRYAYAGRERAMGVVLTGLPAATIVGVPAAGLLAAVGSWRWGLGILAGLAVLAVPPVLGLKAAARGPQKGYLSLILSTARDGRAMIPVAVSFLWFLAGLGLFTYMGQYLSSVFGFGPRARALAVGAYGLLGLAGNLAGIRFAARAGKRAALLLGLTGLVGVFLLVAFNRASGLLALATLGAWGAASWLGMPSLQAIMSELRPLGRGTLLAMNNSAMYLGATLGAVVMGKALDRGGFLAAGLLAAAVMATAALITAVGVRERAPAHVEREMPAGIVP